MTSVQTQKVAIIDNNRISIHIMSVHAFPNVY